MRTVVLDNGAVYPADWCGAAGDTLNINIQNEYSADELAAVFSDANRTRRITFVYGEMQQVFEGYTNLITVIPRGWSPNATLITMGKGESNDNNTALV